MIAYNYFLTLRIFTMVIELIILAELMNKVQCYFQNGWVYANFKYYLQLVCSLRILLIKTDEI